jgi:hypothetical protein
MRLFFGMLDVWRSRYDRFVQVAYPALGFEGTLFLHVCRIAVDHRAVVPAHEAHQVAFEAAAG